MRVPLVTSLPPSMRRPLADGRDAGAEYQDMCIASWRAAGFSEIVSVNAASELEAKPEIYALAERFGVRVVAVDRDAKHITGKPNVYLSDLVNAGCDAAGEGNVVVTNADIMFTGSRTAANLDEFAKPGQFAIGRRVAADVPGGPTREHWYWGFDFFIGNAADFRSVPDIGLVFGCPWWDHLFPALLYLSGKNMVHIEDAFVAHLEHEERAGNPLRAKLGYDFLDKMQTFLRTQAAPTDITARYAAAFQRVVTNRSDNPLRDLAVSVRKLLPWYADLEEEYLMHRFAMHGVHFIDTFRATDQSSQRAPSGAGFGDPLHQRAVAGVG